MDAYLAAAIEEARKSLNAGGIPIGSVLVVDGEIVGRGHNQRVQKGSSVLHAEMDCLENAGRLTAASYRNAVLYSTLHRSAEPPVADGEMDLPVIDPDGVERSPIIEVDDLLAFALTLPR